jgi:hypothetical protein
MACLAAAKASAFYDQQSTAAKARQATSGSGTYGGKPLSASVHEPVGRASDAVGKAFGVSGRMVDYATRVLESAVPEVVQAVTANQAGGGSKGSKKELILNAPENTQRPGVRQENLDAEGDEAGHGRATACFGTVGST